MRVGIGYDLHRLVQGRPLILGGVTIEHSRGLLGHSDGDVLLHAIIDAMLGAMAMGDIGQHFPDTDAKYEGISSLELLSLAVKKTGHAAVVRNVDATIVCQEPKLSRYVQKMKHEVARVLAIDAGMVSIKATTTEGLGPEGAGEAISAFAVVLVENRKGLDAR